MESVWNNIQKVTVWNNISPKARLQQKEYIKKEEIIEQGEVDKTYKTTVYNNKTSLKVTSMQLNDIKMINNGKK